MQLIKASLKAMDEIWKIDKNVQFIHTDPYMYRQPLHAKNDDESAFCENFNLKVRYHSWDMICGASNPELGGDPKYLNYLGINYYFYNQQMVGIDKNTPPSFTFKSISLNHKKRLPLYKIVEELYEKYRRPMIIAETGSYRERRPKWWKYIFEETKRVLDKQLPLLGICSYPTLDIPKGAGFIIPRSGLWDFDQNDKKFKRIPHQETLSLLASEVEELNTLSIENPIQHAAP